MNKIIIALILVSSSIQAAECAPDYATGCPCNQVWTGVKCAKFKSVKQERKFFACIEQVEDYSDAGLAEGSAKCWKSINQGGKQ